MVIDFQIQEHRIFSSFLKTKSIFTCLLRVFGYNPLTNLEAVRLWKPFMLLVEEQNIH